MKTVLLLGATGVFGRRLAANLARVDGISVVLVSRQSAKLAALLDELRTLTPYTEYRTCIAERSRLGEIFQQFKPWLVIDASGPFQGLDYAVPQQALAAGCHFLDLADGRDYLMGFAAALHDEATQRGLVALAGVSSSSALSSAALVALTKNWKRIDTVDIVIAPDGIGDVGEAVVRGVLSYAGKPVPQFRFGALQLVLGWMRGREIDLPRLGKRRVVPVETIEAELFSQRFGVRSRVAFYAGLQSNVEMAGLAVLARLRRLGLFEDLSALVVPFAWGRKFTRLFATPMGGMLVRALGLNADGKWGEADWSLLADLGQGLNVPGLPIVAALRMMLDNQLPVGARVACGDIPLSHIEKEFEVLKITTQRSCVTPDNTIFDVAVQKDSMAKLPQVIVDFHNGSNSSVWQGRAQIERSSHLISRCVGWAVGLPDASADSPVGVTVERERDGTERWTRTFGGKQFHSTMNRGSDNSFWERFGALNFKLDLRVEDGRLLYPITKAHLFGLPMPRALLPKIAAFETVDEQDRFVFDVKIALPIGGLLVHYRGWLQPVKHI
jgi:saccharopine dehydrogenase-like NADP-dependent oxidoreductase